LLIILYFEVNRFQLEVGGHFEFIKIHTILPSSMGGGRKDHPVAIFLAAKTVILA
jgi:hypothetical protein